MLNCFADVVKWSWGVPGVTAYIGGGRGAFLKTQIANKQIYFTLTFVGIALQNKPQQCLQEQATTLETHGATSGIKQKTICHILLHIRFSLTIAFHLQECISWCKTSKLFTEINSVIVVLNNLLKHNTLQYVLIFSC